MGQPGEGRRARGRRLRCDLMESAGSSDVSAETGARATDGEEAKREFRGTVVKIEPGNFFREMSVSHSVHFGCPSSILPDSRI